VAMRITENFTLAELTVTNSGLQNNPNDTQLDALEALCVNILQPIRNHYRLPVKINSAFRSTEVNKAIGGAKTSQHLRGEAADIEVPTVSNVDLWNFIVSNLNFDQCIAEYLSKSIPSAGWVHVSFVANGKNRKDARSCIGKRNYPAGLHYAFS